MTMPQLKSIPYRFTGESPWIDPILTIYPAAEAYDGPLLSAEAMSLLALEQSVVTPEESPELKRFAEVVLWGAVGLYVQKIWDYHGPINLLDTRAWVMGNAQGLGHEWHNHPSSHLTAIFYMEATDAHVTEPEDSYPGDLIFLDPRGHASRFYPEVVRKKMFKNHIVHPNKGMVLVFPSYLQHYVRPGSSWLRMSLNMDFTFLLDAP